MAPPLGAIASPKTVIINEPLLNGRRRRKIVAGVRICASISDGMTIRLHIFRIDALDGVNVTSGARKITTQKILRVAGFCVTFAEAPLCAGTA